MTNICSKMNAQPGDIWGTDMGHEYLIIAKHDDQLYTVLRLFDTYKTGTMKVKSRQLMYTNPAMVQYLFGTTMSQYIKTLREAEFNAIVEAVQDALCLTLIKEVPVEDTTEVLALKAELGNVIKDYDHLVKQLEEMTHYKEVYQQLYIKTLDRVIMMGKG